MQKQGQQVRIIRLTAAVKMEMTVISNTWPAASRRRGGENTLPVQGYPGIDPPRKNAHRASPCAGLGENRRYPPVSGVFAEIRYKTTRTGVDSHHRAIHGSSGAASIPGLPGHFPALDDPVQPLWLDMNTAGASPRSREQCSRRVGVTGGGPPPPPPIGPARRLIFRFLAGYPQC